MARRVSSPIKYRYSLALLIYFVTTRMSSAIDYRRIQGEGGKGKEKEKRQRKKGKRKRKREKKDVTIRQKSNLKFRLAIQILGIL